jgi:hypothetical protein
MRLSVFARLSLIDSLRRWRVAIRARRCAWCRLFAPLRYTEEGLIDYYHHLQQRFVSDADRIFTRLTQQSQQLPQQQQQQKSDDDVVFRQLNDDDNDDDDDDDHHNTNSTSNDDPDSRLSCSDALTELFECVARTVDDQHNLYSIDTLFGPGSERFVIGNLQAQCDKWASRIYQYFLQQIDLGKILARIHTSGRDAPQAERLDPRMLTDLLEELALMSRCTEFYLRFVRQRAGNAAMVKVSDSDAATPRGAHAPLAMAADTYLQEIRSYYVAFEEYFLAESVTRAIAMGREEALQQHEQRQRELLLREALTAPASTTTPTLAPPCRPWSSMCFSCCSTARAARC